MIRKLVLALVALAVTLTLLIGFVVVQEYRKRREQRTLEALGSAVAQRAIQNAPPPPPALPPAIEPSDVKRILGLGQPQPPAGQLADLSWQQIEDKLQTLRGQRAQRAQALDDLESWYNFLAHPSFSGSDDLPQHIANLSAWHTQNPTSSTPLVVVAQANIRHAWEARGGGFAETVSEEGWALFHQRIATGRALLEQAIDLGVTDGHAHSLLIEVAKAQAWSRSQVDEALDAGRKIDAAYVSMYSNMAEHLLPRWHGEEGDIEKFAAEVTQWLPGDDGLDAYGQIAYTINRYEPDRLFYGGYDRKLLAAAAQVLVRRYPHAPNLVPFAALCTIAAQDHKAARYVEPFVNPHAPAERVPGWTTESKKYFQWCEAREVPTDESGWIWAMNSYGNIAFDIDPRFLWCDRGRSLFPVLMFDLEKRVIHERYVGPGGQINKMAFDEGRKWVAAIIRSTEFQGWVVWKTTEPNQPEVHEMDQLPRAIAISSSARQVALGLEKSVQIINLETNEEGPRLETKNHVHFLKYSPDGKRIAVNDEVWDPHTAQQSFQVQGSHVAFDQQGRSLAAYVVHSSAGSKHPLYRYDQDGQNKETLIEDLGAHGHGATLSRDGRLLALTDQPRIMFADRIFVWDLEAKKMVKRFGGHWDHIGILTFSPDAKVLASIGMRGGVIKFWSLSDVETPEESTLSR